MVLPLLAVGMLAVIGAVGLSVDVGHAFLNKTRLQNALDSTALSGARTLMLTSDVAAAEADARDVFKAHLDDGMSGLDVDALVLQYSDTLMPFVGGGADPRYVRAALEGFPSILSFAAVLPNVDGSMTVAATAVAGPAPLGHPAAGKTCDLAPLMVCGSSGDTDCSDGACFGYDIGSRTEYEFGLRSGIDGVSLDAPLVVSADCGEGSVYHDCVPMPGGVGAPGNALLHELGCDGNGCIRKGLAGSSEVCSTGGSVASVDPDGAPGPALEGLSTRFAVETSPLSSAVYPPDVVLAGRDDDVDYWYDEYRRDVASIIAAGSSAEGIPYRRVLTVPVVSCGGGEEDGVNRVLGFLCLFLSRVVDAKKARFYGQFVTRCEASGERAASVPAMSGNYVGPFDIVLYKDPDSHDS